MGVPTVTHDTDDALPGATARDDTARDPAARIRRLLASGPVADAGSGSASPGAPPESPQPESPQPGPEYTPPRPLPPSAALVAAALARFDAPVDVRVRGGLGSGRRTLAAALRARGGWQVTVEDLDELAAPGAPPAVAPDVEVICLRTAPCRHEEAWVRRPRRHPLLIVATGRSDDDDNTRARPHWARGLPPVDARDPEHRTVDTVVTFVERAVDGLAAVRVARLEADLETLAVHPEIGELAEAALCALDH